MKKEGKAIAFPGKYYQGPGTIEKIGGIVASFGAKKPMVVWGKRAKASVVSQMEASFKEKGINYAEHILVTDCTREACAQIVEKTKKEGCDIVIGAGGGKVLDIVKAVAYDCATRVIIIPTVTASDAPTSAATVWYDDEGIGQGWDIWPINPDVVLVDTEITIHTPKKMFLAGVADALATNMEAQAGIRSDVISCAGGRPTDTVAACAQLCFDTLMDYTEDALVCLEAGAITPAFEKVTEAIVLLSGIGWESASVATAHVMGNFLSDLEECHGYMHGEKVAMGICAQLMLDPIHTAKERKEIVSFMARIGLPVCFEDFNMENISKERIYEWCVNRTGEDSTVHNHPFVVTADDLYYAMLAADGYGKKIKAELGL